MSWIPLSGGITDGNFSYWRLPMDRRSGRLWIYLPGFAPNVSGSIYLGMGNGAAGVLDQIDSKIIRVSNFARIVSFELPRLDDPVFGARLQLDSGTLPVLLPSFQFYETTDLAWGESMPWRFSQFEPPTELLWWETDSNGRPLNAWPWRWESSVNKWVSERYYLVSGVGTASNFKSGVLTDDLPFGVANIFIERIDYQFYLGTQVSTVNWLLETREVDSSLVKSTWDSITLSGAPLSATRLVSKPLGQLRIRPKNGWAWKLTRVNPGGSVDFKIQVFTRRVRP